MKTIDMTPTWQATSRMLILAFESGSDNAKEVAKAELLRMGQLLDLNLPTIDGDDHVNSLNKQLGAIADGQEDI